LSQVDVINAELWVCVCVCVGARAYAWLCTCSLLCIHITDTPESNARSNQIWESNTLTPVQQRDANIQESLSHEPPGNEFFYTKMRFHYMGIMHNCIRTLFMFLQDLLIYN